MGKVAKLTKVPDKTNLQYLAEFIKDNEEAMEFLDAISNEIDDYKEEITDLKDEKKNLENDVKDKESEIESLEDDAELADEWDLGIGTLKFETSGSLDLVMLMETFGEKVTEHGARKVTQFLQIADIL